ncbi:uncharacterized protein LOC119368737 [Triticum dicoccoides]|uniref:uncharacterized protein LOC119368737 n=1 Tax=Triticum dicoccoides TaxID=85692 RepID=UPI00188F88B3|nr:uncharacterized protein LOC119368737 [Triticum dicoccoides]
MEWEPEQQDLGGLGLAGICREIYRVVFRSILPYAAAGVEAALLSVLLLARVAGYHGLDSLHGLIGFLVGLLFEGVSINVLVFFSLVCTGLYVFLIASSTVPRATSALLGDSSDTSLVSPVSLILPCCFSVSFVRFRE